ncbi:hypothetical protein FRC17_010170 [Serendipita sp. 399]|nr:hypothetical protein FRC17_010170 [Serendipita sp. 399]
MAVMGPPPPRDRDSGWPKDKGPRASFSSQSNFQWKTSENSTPVTSSWSKGPQPSSWSNSNETQSKSKATSRSIEDDWADLVPSSPSKGSSNPDSLESGSKKSDGWAPSTGVQSQPKPTSRSMEDDWADLRSSNSKDSAKGNDSSKSWNGNSDGWGSSSSFSFTTPQPPVSNPWASPTMAPTDPPSKPVEDVASSQSARSGGGQWSTGSAWRQAPPNLLPVGSHEQKTASSVKPALSPNSVPVTSSPAPTNLQGVMPFDTNRRDMDRPWGIQSSPVDIAMKDGQNDAQKPSLSLSVGQSSSMETGRLPTSAITESYGSRTPLSAAEPKSREYQPYPVSASIAMTTPMNSAGPNRPTASENRYDNETQALWCNRIHLIRTAVDYLDERTKIQDSMASRQSLVKRIRSKANVPPLEALPNEKELDLKNLDERYQGVLKQLVQKTEEDWLSNVSASGDENWWPIPRLGISYENALDSLEQDVYNLEEMIKETTVVAMDEEPPKIKAGVELAKLPSYAELTENIDDLGERIRTTAQLELQQSQLSTKTLAERVRALVLTDDAASKLQAYLVKNLQPQIEKNQSDNRAHLERIQVEIKKEYEEELVTRQQERGQRYQEFLNRLQADPAIMEMDRIGGIIDDRWNDVISPSTTIRRPPAAIRIPEAFS